MPGISGSVGACKGVSMSALPGVRSLPVAVLLRCQPNNCIKRTCVLGRLLRQIAAQAEHPRGDSIEAVLAAIGGERAADMVIPTAPEER